MGRKGNGVDGDSVSCSGYSIALSRRLSAQLSMVFVVVVVVFVELMPRVKSDVNQETAIPPIWKMIQTRSHGRTDIHACARKHTRAQTHTHTYTHNRARALTLMHAACMHARTNTHTHTHTHTHIHTHILDTLQYRNRQILCGLIHAWPTIQPKLSL